MMDNFSEIISNAKEKGKLIFKNSGMKSMSKNDLRIPINDIYHIDISENKFISLPEVISEFIYLEVLLCSNNIIRCIPSSINNISYLEILDISCNHLTSLHPSVCRLQYLKILIISSNRLVSLPNSIGRLSSLEEFDSSCNSLTCLPEELSNLHKLKYLNFRHNKLLDVPINLHKLDLEELDLSENQLTSIPCEYRHIGSLKTFNLCGNPLSSPPANVCNKGLQHIMKYLQSEQKRQQTMTSMSSQNSIDYHHPMGNYNQSEQSHVEINGTDSITATSTNSQQSIAELDLEQDHNREDVFSENSNHVNNIDNCDSSSHNLLPDSALASSDMILNTVEESTVLSPEGHYKKNRVMASFTSKRSVPQVSPSIYRSSRFVSHNNRLSSDSVSKSRRNSLPSNERLIEPSAAPTGDNDQPSQCVVLIDSGAGNDRRTASSYVAFTQSNNSSTRNSQPRFVKNVPASPLRVVRPKFVDIPTERKIENLSTKASFSRSNDTSQKIGDKIKKFHKIVEAQLHVQIDSKKLSQDLSNGIYLCHLANILIPRCITTVHTPSPGQQELGKQKAKRNLDNFLEACRRNGVAENCLFNARDVMNSNPNALLPMANSVDALIESIRTKKTLSSVIAGPNNRGSDHIDWHGVLNNPRSLSNRSAAPISSRSSFQSYGTVGRQSKPNPRIVSKVHSEDVIQYASEV